MTNDSGVPRVQRIGAGLSFILFPLMLLAGFLLHPNFFSLELVTDAEVWAREFRGNLPFHLGHLIVLFTVPLIIVVGVRCMRVTSGPGAWPIFIGGVASIGHHLEASGDRHRRRVAAVAGWGHRGHHLGWRSAHVRRVHSHGSPRATG